MDSGGGATEEEAVADVAESEQPESSNPVRELKEAIQHFQNSSTLTLQSITSSTEPPSPQMVTAENSEASDPVQWLKEQTLQLTNNTAELLAHQTQGVGHEEALDLHSETPRNLALGFLSQTSEQIRGLHEHKEAPSGDSDSEGVEPEPSSQPRYVGMLNTLDTIFKEEGPGALFKGVIPRVVQLGLNHALRFSAYESARKTLVEGMLYGTMASKLGGFANLLTLGTATQLVLHPGYPQV